MNPFDLQYPPNSDCEALWSRMADDIRANGYSVQPNALSMGLGMALRQEMMDTNDQLFKLAGVGRENDFQKAQSIRQDQIRWITGSSNAQLAWLDWCKQLQVFLNRQLILGLFSFESHFAHYKPGAFYKTHVDSFRGQANRVLSLVAYLNADWHARDGGELVIYSPENPAQEVVRIEPTMGTVVAFLSEEFPHEVLPTAKDRYSIAGWYRLNTSIQGQIDPPQ
ncbi:MAG: 2OG-Fe(II) oxygenase [Limnobacter sp.]|nr:2OG-Fe(II) oxygenase [Limnobacter sp.]